MGLPLCTVDFFSLNQPSVSLLLHDSPSSKFPRKVPFEKFKPLLYVWGPFCHAVDQQCQSKNENSKQMQKNHQLHRVLFFCTNPNKEECGFYVD